MIMVTAPHVLIESPPIFPRKAPIPDKKAFFKLKDLKNSKTVAPTNTPIIDPIIAPKTGVTNAPLIAPPIPPSMLPVIPHFEAPYFFADKTINKYSKNSKTKTIKNNVKTKANEYCSKFVIKP